ncbi:MAG: class I SAM-dependent methyltransferase [Chitinophagales bacterium]|nr:class I SAM-dependent methyltransferase [Chitinophagales bacterium]HNL08690.1 class I SAM-dependent methyltransferase [Chitinophagales bacterium]
MLKWKLAQQLELLWWKNYLRRKSPADYLVWKRRYWQNFLQNLALQLPPICDVLDAGCGPAGIFTILEQQKVVAIDPLLAHYAEQLSPHFTTAAYPHVRFEDCRLEDINYQQSFDYIFCINAINHVSDLPLALARLSAALRPNATLVLSTDVHNHNFFKHLFRLLPLDALHPHQFDLAEYRQQLPNDLHVVQEINYQQAFFFDYYVWILQKNSH